MVEPTSIWQLEWACQMEVGAQAEGHLGTAMFAGPGVGLVIRSLLWSEPYMGCREGGWS